MPNRQSTCARQGVNLPAGWVFALMMLEEAPTPCRRTGFHISSNSLWADGDAGLPPAAATVGSTMMRSPGAAASIAGWIEAAATTWGGAVPPMVTVTASIDCLPLAAVMTSSPHCAVDAPGAYSACC